jgi:hypothetical protein
MCSVQNFMVKDKQHEYWHKLTGLWLVLFFISVVCLAQTLRKPGSEHSF